MKKTSTVFIILSFLLAACATNSTQTANTLATDSPTAPGSTVSAREAVLSEIKNTVSARKTSADELTSAEQGMSILEGGSVETGEDGRVRIDLTPEGTIVRVGPNSAFNLPKLTEENGKPRTTIELLFGQVFILLKGGSLSVDTPSGVASVRGSLLSVKYDKDTKRTSATCMEGDCVVQGEDGKEIDLPQGEESFIDDSGSAMDPFPMDRDEVQNWLDENPDMNLFMPDLPNPEDFPDLPPDFNGDMQGTATEAPTMEGVATDAATTEPATDAATPPPDSGDGSGDPSSNP